MSSSTRVFNKIRTGSKSSLFIEGLIANTSHSEGRSISTLGSFQSIKMKLVRHCVKCDAREDVDIDAEIELLGADTPLTALAHPCKRCGCEKTSVLPA